MDFMPLQRGISMKTIKVTLASVLAAAMLLGMSACGDMSRRGRDTAIGAGAGAVGGAVLTDGSGIGTIGGAAVGGLIGNEVGQERR
jgi:osmotically inducible lipoprotein OsmB